jgi:hypothetical protein
VIGLLLEQLLGWVRVAQIAVDVVFSARPADAPRLEALGA